MGVYWDLTSFLVRLKSWSFTLRVATCEDAGTIVVVSAEPSSACSLLGLAIKFSDLKAGRPCVLG